MIHFSRATIFSISYLSSISLILQTTFVVSNHTWWHTLKSNDGMSTKTVILTILDVADKLPEYKLALETVNCYANLHGYSHRVIIAERTDASVGVYLEDNATIVLPSVHNLTKHCNHTEMFFQRHCMVAHYMEENINEIDLVLFMDADVGVVNPNHTIHEYLPTNVTVDMVFYNRLFLHEIAAGGYLARNTDYSRNFLHYWADYILPKGFPGTDNGAIHIVFMEKFAQPEGQRKCGDYINQTKDYDKLFEFEACVRDHFGLNESLYTEYDSQGQMRGRVSIRPFGKSWVRDSGVTQSRFSHDDFMFHQWKTSNMEKPLPNSFMAEWQYPFRDKEFNIEKCLEGSPEPMVPKDGLFVAQAQIDRDLSKVIADTTGYYQYVLNRMKDNTNTSEATTVLTMTTEVDTLVESVKAPYEQEPMSHFSQGVISNITSPLSPIANMDQPNNLLMPNPNNFTKNVLLIPIVIFNVIVIISLLTFTIRKVFSRRRRRRFSRLLIVFL